MQLITNHFRLPSIETVAIMSTICVLYREALVKMHEVYTGNPKLGDANSINSQLEDSKAKLDGLDSELAKYEV